jgi:hypothetical protein
MRLYNPKFRQHRLFQFVAFNILQRREVASATHSLTKASNFDRSAELIATLTVEDMKTAIEQERSKQPVINPEVLKCQLNWLQTYGITTITRSYAQ